MSKVQLLTLPKNVGQKIVESAGLIACPLLGTDKFVRFCCDRNLRINRERLLRFERLGLIRPVFRVRSPTDETSVPFEIPIRDGNNWFEFGNAWEPADDACEIATPASGDRAQEGYYSIFQVDEIRLLLGPLTLELHLDSYAEKSEEAARNADRNVAKWIQLGKSFVQRSNANEFRQALALLCQFISNRYYPHTQGDQRNIRIPGGSSSWDQWISVDGGNWNWEEAARAWDPRAVEHYFHLTAEKLQHAYETLAGSSSFLDPLQHWYPLVQFVSLDERKRLKGDALLAETLREGALMLRRLHRELYGVELPPPNEVHGTVITHVPELSVREDPRRHLEFVANRFGLNPQPKLVLVLEGATEERAVIRLFDAVFGFPAGRCGIELLVIGGVDNATGGRQDDRYRAILRLIDYLHHHQTLVYIVLDNENRAGKLKKAAGEMHSIHGHRNRVTRPEYIQVWKRSFEFDNFSDSELSAALTRVSSGRANFARAKIAQCRQAKNPGAELSQLFRDATGYRLPKIKLVDELLDIMLSGRARKAVKNRPIVRVLRKVVELAVRNPFPVMQEIWLKNQASKVLAQKR